ncbi:hypothetical protein ACH4SK_05100 [Streptomyces inhibens]|uniref:hypothetical protein n=1 Tax=Streptomyces inhibens TaxID=2293571 RepID=UPI00379F9014
MTARAGRFQHLHGATINPAGRDCSGTACEDPSAHEIAIALHPYGTGPFADASSIRNTCLRHGDG